MIVTCRLNKKELVPWSLSELCRSVQLNLHHIILPSVIVYENRHLTIGVCVTKARFMGSACGALDAEC